MSAHMHPFRMLPAFRSGSDTPWGGSALRELYNKDIPCDHTGEALEVSALPGLVSRDADGVGFDELIRRHGESLVGKYCSFPLLLKLIDARDRLSVQVHPDDAFANANESGKLGKTEAWVILRARPDARLIIGLKQGAGPDDLRAALRGDPASVSELMNSVPVSPGDVFYIPAGTAHAIGAGIALYEIQQSSDVTYRLWDWDRADELGRRRELHIDKALAVLRSGSPNRAVRGITEPLGGGTCTRYISEKYFTLDRLSIMDYMHINHMTGTCVMLTALGTGEIRWDGGAVKFNPGDTVFVPSDSCGFDIVGKCDILRSCPT